MTAGVGFHDLPSHRHEVIRRTERFQIEIHGAAANQPVAGGNVFI